MSEAGSEEVAVANPEPVGSPPHVRGLEVAAAIVAGLGCGLLFHRFVVLPFVTQSTAAKALLYVGVGLLSGARAAWKYRGRPTASVPRSARVGLGLVAGLAGAGLSFLLVPPLGHLPLRAHALPGFDIELPAGNEDQASVPNYGSGRMMVKKVGGMPAAVQLTWSAGEIDEKTFGLIANGFAAGGAGASVHALRRYVTVSAPGVSSTRSMTARAGSMELWATELPCATRNLIVLTAGENWGVERLHRRVVSTFQCRPDATKETKETLEDVPVIVPLGAGWVRVPRAGNQLQLTNGAGLLTVQLSAAADPEKVVETMASSHMLPGMEIGKRQGERWPLDMELHGQHTQGWLRVRSCPDLVLTIWWLALTPGSTDGLAAADAARCRRVDEAPQVWPESPAPASGR